MSVEINKELRRAVDTGKVLFGSKIALEHAMHGTAQAIICAYNLPKEQKAKIEHTAKLSGVPFHASPNTGLELGEVCGKPFNIGSATVTDAGRSKIVSAIK